MKIQRISIASLLFALLLMVGNSCSDDNPYFSNELGSKLEMTKEYKLSTFTLEKHIWEIPDSTEQITVQFRSHTDSSIKEFNAIVSIQDGKYLFCVQIPKNASLADSDYDVIGILPNGKKLGARLIATFKNEMLHLIMSNEVEYGLENGDGSAEDPYLIYTADDFDTFAFGLYKDTVNHAKGIYFKQAGDFIAPPLSDVYSGRNYAGYTFAGTYDGGGHTIMLNYTGSNSDKDQNIGLFKVLCDGAVIKNLNVNANIRGVKNNAGAIAGKTEGNVSLEGIQVSGSIQDCGNNIGGFIGMSQNLTATNCRILATVSGTNSVGGLVGLTEGKLTVMNYTNLVPGKESGTIGILAKGLRVGGIAGFINNGELYASNISLFHAIPQEDIDLKIIYSKDGSAGGLVGQLINSSTSQIINTQVAAPVRSDGNSVGGLIGVYRSNNLTISNSQFNSYLKGNVSVGGFIGDATGEIKVEGNSQIAEVYNGGYNSIEGNESVGGAIGLAKCTLTAKDEFTINTQVVAYKTTAGGLIGRLDAKTLTLENFTFDQNMHVYGPDAVGGVVGQAMNGSVIDGKASVSLDNSIPKADSFTSHFPGTVSSGSPYGGSSSNGTAMGGIVGYAYSSSIIGVCFSGTVVGGERVGGIVGQIHWVDAGYSFKNCINKGKSVTNSSGSKTGGVCGYLQYYHGYVGSLINYGKVDGLSATGGVFGQATVEGGDKMVLTYMVNAGDVTGKGDVGGCVGFITGNGSTGNEINNSVNFSSVTHSGGGSIGGILGFGDIAKSCIFSSANHGNIKGGSSGASNIGGICGRFGWHSSSSVTKNDNIELARCCNTGTISSDHKDSYVGGVLGRQALGSTIDETHWMVHDCYNKGPVPSKHNTDAGGIVGYVDHTSEVQCCYSSGDIEKGNGVVGTHKGGSVWYHHHLYYLEGTAKDWNCDKIKKSNKGKESSYGGFDFNKVWQIDSSKNDEMPHLKDCHFQFFSL